MPTNGQREATFRKRTDSGQVDGTRADGRWDTRAGSGGGGEWD